MPCNNNDDRTCEHHSPNVRSGVGFVTQIGAGNSTFVPSAATRYVTTGSVAIESVMSLTQPYTVSNCNELLAFTVLLAPLA